MRHAPHHVWLHEVREALGPTVESDGKGLKITVSCRGGCRQKHMIDARLAPADVLRNRLLKWGWQLGEKLVCPTCSKGDAMNKPTSDAKVVPLIQQDASPSAKRATRQVMQWLEEAYDEEAKGYRQNFSDKTISTETGVAEGRVKEIREEFFGPLREPSEILTFRADLDRIEREAKAAYEVTMSAIVDARQRLTKLAGKNGWALP